MRATKRSTLGGWCVVVVLAGASPSSGRDPAIAAGAYHSMVIASDGTVWAWGHNSKGTLGNGTSNNDIPLPVQVKDASGSGVLSGVAAIAGGWHVSLALKDDRSVWALGYNVSGALGNGTKVDSSLPVQVKDPSGNSILTGVSRLSPPSGSMLREPGGHHGNACSRVSMPLHPNPNRDRTAD